MVKMCEFMCCILLIGLLAGCRCDYSIPLAYVGFINHYKVGDTVRFVGPSNDTEGFYVTSIDSIFQCGAFMAGKREDIIIRIGNFPRNDWKSGIEASSGNEEKGRVIDQEMICFSKEMYPITDSTKQKPYTVFINFRDFEGRVNKISFIHQDSLLRYAGIDSGAVFQTTGKLTNEAVTKIIWTEQYGLTAYYKDDGSLYKMTKMMPVVGAK